MICRRPPTRAGDHPHSGRQLLNRRVFLRSTILLPSTIDVSSALLHKFYRAEGLLRQLPAWTPTDPVDWWVPTVNDPFWKKTRQPLTGQLKFCHRVPTSGWSDHTFAEFAPNPRLQASLFRLSESDVDGFIRLLCAACAALTQSDPGLRSVSVGNRGTDGSIVIFPHSSQLESGLANLWKWLSDSRKPRVVRATVALCAVCNLHPFADGNGRTSRWLFTSLLDVGSDQDVGFYPLYEYFIRDQGTSLLCFRIAELCGDWDPLFCYIAEIFEAMSMTRLAAHVKTVARNGAYYPLGAIRPRPSARLTTGT